MNTTSKLLISSAALLLLLGALALDSAAVHQATPDRLKAHVILMIIGLAGSTALALLRYRALSGWPLRRRWLPLRLEWLAEVRLSSWLLGLAILQLVLVLVPGLSEVRNGARRWPIWGGQPSEFAKLALIIAFADQLARRHIEAGSGRGFVQPAVLAGLVAGLIFCEPDWGGAVVTALVATGMLLLGGARWFHVLYGGAILSLLAVHGLLADPHRLGRVLSFGDPEAHQDGAGFQQWRALLAIASGGWFGQWAGDGRFKAGYVPEQETDFIFSLIGEEGGLVGASVVLLLYVIIVLCGFRIAAKVTDPFGQYLAAGITLWIGLQALIHIGVNTCSLPNKGLPLPFVSYGGSNLICLLAGVGLLVSVARHAPVAAQPDTVESGSVGQWALLKCRVRRLVRGQPTPEIRHAYQLPPRTDRTAAAKAPAEWAARWEGVQGAKAARRAGVSPQRQSEAGRRGEERLAGAGC